MNDATISQEKGEILRFKHDVLIVGAGGSGLRAAIEAARQGVSVAIVSKSLLGKAHTVMAEGGAAAALKNADSRDSWEVHFRDTMRGGKLHNDWRMAEIHAKEAPDRIRELEEWGAVFDRTKDGRINQRNFGGHRYPRLAHVGDRTGLEIIRTLQDKVIHEPNVSIYMETTITKLLVKDNAIVGAFGYRRQDGKLILFEVKSVVLCTGGIGKIYRVSSNSWEYTGDGLVLALDAGAELTDMEFVQFHPTGMLYPESVRGTLVTEGVRGEGGVLLNNKGERFMFRYVPDMFKGEFAETEEEAERWLAGDDSARRPPELLTRDVVARAIRAEVQAGRGSPRGGAYLDIASRRPADYIKKKLPAMYHQFLKLADVDITKEPMEVGPTAHYMMGGIRVKAETAATNVKGLYAAGECATGLHGANRLGGNSLTDILVFGKIAGEHAGKQAKDNPSHPSVDSGTLSKTIEEALAPFDESRTEDPYKLHKELRDIMERYVGMIRNKDDLEEGIRQLQSLLERTRLARARGDRVYNPGWHRALDIYNMVLVGLAIANAALRREESRGAHTREDFPKSNPDLVNVLYVIKKLPSGELEIREERYEPIPDRLRKIVEEEYK